MYFLESIGVTKFKLTRQKGNEESLMKTLMLHIIVIELSQYTVR